MIKIVTYRGYKTSVIYADETTFGTPVTADTVVEGKVQTFTLTQNNNLVRVTGLGEGRTETAVLLGNYECTWSMEYYPSAFDFLKFGIGVMSGAGSTASPYVLTEGVFRSTTDLNTATIELGSNDVSGGTHNVDTITSAIINSVGIALELGAPVKVTLEGFGQKVVSKATAPVTQTNDTNQIWMYQQGTFKWDGSAVGRVQSATININNNIDPEVGRGLGSRFVQEWEPGLLKYDWTVVVKMTNTVATTMRDAFYGQANSPSEGVDPAEPTFYDIIFNLSQGSSSGDKQGQILVSDCAINDISKPVNIGDNLVEVTINGTGKNATNDSGRKLFKWWTTT